MTDKDELLNSNYDGIQEYDNDLPRWWLMLFIITIVLGIIYAIFFYSPANQSDEERLAQQLQEIKAKHAITASSSETKEITDEMLIQLTKQESVLSSGKAIYDSKCVACHMSQGQGLVGPNLTDDFWIHGGKITQIRTTVMEGVLAKGMLAWKTILKPEEIDSVVAYVWSLHGTNPPNPKAPEGELVVRD